MKRPTDVTKVILAVSTLLGAAGTFAKQMIDVKRDLAFNWENFGEQVGELELLKDRVAVLEDRCAPPPERKP